LAAKARSKDYWRGKGLRGKAQTAQGRNVGGKGELTEYRTITAAIYGLDLCNAPNLKKF
jgi:hypothetical protein